MKDYPGGTWIVMEEKTEITKANLVCVGYKYNKKKVLTFIMTRGAGSTEEGDPYEARFPNRYGNLCIHHVACPKCISLFFKYSNKVDLHNQSRQFDLALEKKWVTTNPYFRLFTTEVGCTVIDAWKMFKNNHKIAGVSPNVVQHTDILAYEMLEYANQLEERNSQDTSPPTTVEATSVSDVSSVSASKDSKTFSSSHTRVLLTSSKQVRCIWCSRVHLVDRKVTMKCQECGYGFCRDNSGRDCWSHHVALGGIPQAPKKGTKKKRCNEVNQEFEEANM